jgi:hypothetical protein
MCQLCRPLSRCVPAAPALLAPVQKQMWLLAENYNLDIVPLEAEGGAGGYSPPDEDRIYICDANGKPLDISIPVGITIHSGRTPMIELVAHITARVAELRGANPKHADAPVRIRLTSTFGMMTAIHGSLGKPVNAGAGHFATKLTVRKLPARAVGLLHLISC